MRYLLLFLFTLPCQAQYLEFDVMTHETGGVSFMMLHVLQFEESVRKISVAITLQRESPRCRTKSDLSFSIYHAAFPNSQFEPAARLTIDDDIYHLHEELVGLTEDRIITRTYDLTLVIEDLMEMNIPYATYEISGYELPGIRDAIDEFLKQILALPEC